MRSLIACTAPVPLSSSAAKIISWNSRWNTGNAIRCSMIVRRQRLRPRSRGRRRSCRTKNSRPGSIASGPAISAGDHRVAAAGEVAQRPAGSRPRRRHCSRHRSARRAPSHRWACGGEARGDAVAELREARATHEQHVDAVEQERDPLEQPLDRLVAERRRTRRSRPSAPASRRAAAAEQGRADRARRRAVTRPGSGSRTARRRSRTPSSRARAGREEAPVVAASRWRGRTRRSATQTSAHSSIASRIATTPPCGPLGRKNSASSRPVA